jgi:hypothetical protein
MHKRQLAEILRDAEVAHAIRPVVFKHALTLGETAAALSACGVPRAEVVARITNDKLLDKPDCPPIFTFET